MTLFPAPAKTAPSRILVVEDEVLIAMDIQLQLQELGYAPVGLATRGEQAVEMARALRPDLVLMDIQLSGKMDGIEAAQELRVQLSVPVVFLTSFAADEILERAQFSEPYGYILKPFTEREIRTVIEMALYKHQADISLQNTIISLRDSAQHTQAILDHIVDAVITIDDHGRMESFNQAASAMFGYSAQEAIGQNVSILMPQPHQSQHDGYLQHHRETGENCIIGGTRELDGLRKDGSTFPINLSVSKLTMAGKTTFIGLVLDMTQRRKDEESIRRLAYYDALTDLPNRRLLLDYLRHAILSSTRTGQRGAVMFLDLDHFKRVNDDLGHSAGDELLQQVAQRLQISVREGDIVARVGGDEFVLVLEAMGLQDQEAASRAEAIAHKVLQSLGQPYVLHGKTYTSTPSIGIMMFINDHESMEELLKKADSGMYQAKAAGRNQVRFFDPTVQAAATARAQLEEDLRQGLNRQEFLLHYQIQISADGRPIGVEALVRWQHAKQGMVSPANFIPLAEETGLILPLGQWVLETACHQLVAWSKTPATAPWTMAVNVSALQFAQSNFVAQVEWALHTTGASPLLLKLELTESMLVGDVDALIVKMNALKTLGVSFSLDDFGTGYSSLSYLKRLPLAQLKIDQSFVRDALTDPNDAVIAKTIVSLGHSLGLKVIAEGVETEGQRDFLIDIGCDSLQGYLFGRPTLPGLVWSPPG